MQKVRIISPASPKGKLDVDAVKTAFLKMGYLPELGTHALDANRFMAGTDEHRTQDVMDAFMDPTVDAIVAMRGGAGSGRLLDKLDYKKIAKNKKPFFGFSDLTALQLGLWSQAGLVSFTGIVSSYLAGERSAQLIKLFKDVLNKKELAYGGLKKMTPGRAEGHIIAGTLTLIASLVGTKYMPDMRGAILVFEQVEMEPYQIDRALNQLRLAGVFDQLAGIVVGGFARCEPKDKEDGTADDVVRDYFSGMKIPVVTGLKYAHGTNHVVLPIGAVGELDANKGTLTIKEY